MQRIFIEPELKTRRQKPGAFQSIGRRCGATNMSWRTLVPSDVQESPSSSVPIDAIRDEKYEDELDASLNVSKRISSHRIYMADIHRYLYSRPGSLPKFNFTVTWRKQRMGGGEEIPVSSQCAAFKSCSYWPKENYNTSRSGNICLSREFLKFLDRIDVP
ncbi:hypothetical protein AVEN_133683-1 [Araneus ventricosus]|uniref:Uncharacterized protein n=1 Tax=Araneus ventricosus TaxID=182803 RepID=A0A4Y2B7H9_ARAVE|nr:hypothetical protein AVEN_133683-1 [Araneus ventricosus]